MLTEADVIHVKGLSIDGLTGLSAVSQAARVLGLSDELVRHALDSWRNSLLRCHSTSSCCSTACPRRGASMPSIFPKRI